MTKVFVPGFFLTLIGLHLCVWFSSWPHHQGDTLFLVTLMDTFIIAAISGLFFAVWVDSDD